MYRAEICIPGREIRMHNFARVKVHESEDQRYQENRGISQSLLSERISMRSLPRPAARENYYCLNGEFRGSSPLSKENGTLLATSRAILFY